MVDYIDGFSYIEPSLNPWDESYLVMVDDVFDVILDLVLSVFTTMFIKEIGLKLFFFVDSYCGLGIRVTGFIE